MQAARTMIAAVAALIAIALSLPSDAATPAKSAPPRASGAKKAEAPAPRAAAAGHLLDTIRKRAAIRVGIAPQIPWAMRDPTGEWQGYEIDVARQLAADLGVELVLVRIPFVQFTDALTD